MAKLCSIRLVFHADIRATLLYISNECRYRRACNVGQVSGRQYWNRDKHGARARPRRKCLRYLLIAMKIDKPGWVEVNDKCYL